MALDKQGLLLIFSKVDYVPTVAEWQALINLIPDGSNEEVATSVANLLVQNPSFAAQLQPKTADDLSNPNSVTLPTTLAVANRILDIINDYSAKIATVSEQASTGIEDEAVPATVPIDTTNKFVKYSIATAGTYANFPDASSTSIEVTSDDLNEGVVELWGKNGVWSKNIIPFPMETVVQKSAIQNDLSTYDPTKVLGAGAASLLAPKSDFDIYKLITDTVNNFLNQTFGSTKPGVAFALRDNTPQKNDALRISALGEILAGILHANSFSAGSMSSDTTLDLGDAITFSSNRVYAFCIHDKTPQKNLLFGIKWNGILKRYRPDLSIQKIIYGLHYDNEIIVTWGQSLSLGAASVLMTMQSLYNFYILNTGISTNPLQTTTPYTGANSIIPYTGTKTLGFENPLLGYGDYMVQKIIKSGAGAYIENIDPVTKFVYASLGVGGEPLSDLIKGTSIYNDAIAAIAKIVSLSDGTTGLERINFLHGEGNYTIPVNPDGSTYKAAFLQMQSDFNADVKATTGQTRDTQWFIYQNSGLVIGGDIYPNIPLTLADIGINSPNCYLVKPLYDLPFNAASSHMIAEGYKAYGAFNAFVAHKVLIEGIDWKPLYPTLFTNAGATIVISFHVPHGELVIDTDLVTDPGTYGFRAYDATGNIIGISSVVITGKDEVTITLAAPMPAGGRIDYAFIQGVTNNGNISGSRGNLRDTQGDVEIYRDEITNFTYKMYNWCVCFSKTF